MNVIMLWKKEKRSWLSSYSRRGAIIIKTRVLRTKWGRQLTSVFEWGPGTEHTHINTQSHEDWYAFSPYVSTHTISRTHTNTHTYSNSLPATTNHWSISHNPPPASAAALSIQTNCPSSSTGCRKRHKAKADSWAGPLCWIWSGGSLHVLPRKRTIMSWLLPACQLALCCFLQLFEKEILGIAEALGSHSIRRVTILSNPFMFSSHPHLAQLYLVCWCANM